MQKRPTLELPFLSTSLVQDPSLRTEGSDLVLAFDFYKDDGERSEANLRFTKQRAFRKRSESHCDAWHVSDVYDVVCEILDSDFVKDLHSASSAPKNSQWILHHYMLFVDGFGCLEVVSEAVKLEIN